MPEENKELNPFRHWMGLSDLECYVPRKSLNQLVQSSLKTFVDTGRAPNYAFYGKSGSGKSLLLEYIANHYCGSEKKILPLRIDAGDALGRYSYASFMGLVLKALEEEYRKQSIFAKVWHKLSNIKVGEIGTNLGGVGVHVKLLGADEKELEREFAINGRKRLVQSISKVKKVLGVERVLILVDEADSMTSELAGDIKQLLRGIDNPGYCMFIASVAQKVLPMPTEEDESNPEKSKWRAFDPIKIEPFKHSEFFDLISKALERHEKLYNSLWVMVESTYDAIYTLCDGSPLFAHKIAYFAFEHGKILPERKFCLTQEAWDAFLVSEQQRADRFIDIFNNKRDEIQLGDLYKSENGGSSKSEEALGK
ncbi:MAG: ATP-binding protein [Chloroflexi bacterium]|nr:ATP-binding protein [Chloroflexota bacterium]